MSKSETVLTVHVLLPSMHPLLTAHWSGDLRVLSLFFLLSPDVPCLQRLGQKQVLRPISSFCTIQIFGNAKRENFSS